MLSNDPPTPTSPPPLFLKPSVDKSFSFITQTQGLQVHKPQKEGQGCRGGGGDGMGKRMVSRKIRGEGTEPPYPGLTSTAAHPSPHPSASTPAPSLPCNTSLFRSAALPHVRRVQTVSGAAWCCQALSGVLGWGPGAGVADWPCGRSSPFLLNQ